MALNPIEVVQEALSDRGMYQGPAYCKSTDRTRQLIQRNILEQVSFGASLEPANDEFVFIECREDQGRRKKVGSLQFFQNFQPVSLREMHIEKHHIGLGFRNDSHGLIPISCLCYDIDVVD